MDAQIERYRATRGLKWNYSSIRSGSVLYLDIETTGGLIPRKVRPRLISIAGDYGQELLGPELIPELIPLIESPDVRVIGHNLAFDLGIIRAQAGRRLKFTNLWDTMLSHKLLNNGLNSSATLQAVAKSLLGVDLDKSLQTSDWDGELSDEQLAYAVKDSLILEPIYIGQKALLEHASLLEVAKVEFEALPTIIELEHNGIGFNLDLARECLENLAREKARLEHELKEKAAGRGWVPTNTKNGKVQEFNSRSYIQISSVIEHCFGHKPIDTTTKTLEKLCQEYPDDHLTSLLLEYKTIEKKFGLLKGWIEKAEGGRLYSSFWQLGAESGRIISSKPNLQQIPPDLRHLFVAPIGKVLVEADFSAIELRLAAALSKDKNLLQIFNDGLDPHKRTAQSIFGKEEISKEQRQIAKALNFGTLYGGGPKMVMNKLPGLHEQEARDLIDRFYNSYTDLKAWQIQISDFAMVEIIGGKAWKVAKSILGRRRYIEPHRKTLLLTTPVQASGADLQKIALARLYQELIGPVYEDFRLVNAVHDSILLEVPEAKVEEASMLLKGIMEKAGNELLKVIPCITDVKVGRDWSFEVVTKASCVQTIKEGAIQEGSSERNTN